MPRIRAVIFDCYGTLVDVLTNERKDEIFSSLSLYLRYYGANINSDTLKALFYAEKDRYLKTHDEIYAEFDMEAVFKTILGAVGLNSPFLSESCCKLFRLVSRDRFQLFPDSLPALKGLKSRGLPMAMLSNAQDVLRRDRHAGTEAIFQLFCGLQLLGIPET